jgi:TonB family protein
MAERRKGRASAARILSQRRAVSVINDNTLKRLFIVVVALLPLLSIAAPNASDWIRAPKPKFPKDALKKGSEGSVKLQVVLNNEGHVVSSRVLRSSGEPALDAAAQAGVAKWQLNPSMIRPPDFNPRPS